jgi:hypothetical protein
MPTLPDGGHVADVDVREIVQALGRLEQFADRRVRQALQIASTEVAAEAKRNHDYRDRTGRLTSSIRPDEVEGTFGTGFRAKLLAGGLRGVTYAAHVEYGTRAHVIRPRRRKALRFVSGGNTVFAQRVNHPGTRAYRFMRNALEAKLPLAERLVEQAMELAADEAGF